MRRPKACEPCAAQSTSQANAAQALIRWAETSRVQGVAQVVKYLRHTYAT